MTGDRRSKSQSALIISIEIKTIAPGMDPDSTEEV